MESNILCAHLNRITYWLNVFVLIISLLFPCINVLFMISDGTCINFTTYIGTEKKMVLLDLLLPWVLSVTRCAASACRVSYD